MTFWSPIPVARTARCIDNRFVDYYVDRIWFCGRRVVHVWSLQSIMSHHVTFSIIGIEVSAFTLALIGRILIYIQAARLLLGDGRAAVGTPKLEHSERQSVCSIQLEIERIVG